MQGVAHTVGHCLQVCGWVGQPCREWHTPWVTVCRCVGVWGSHAGSGTHRGSLSAGVWVCGAAMQGVAHTVGHCLQVCGWVGAAMQGVAHTLGHS